MVIEASGNPFSHVSCQWCATRCVQMAALTVPANLSWFPISAVWPKWPISHWLLGGDLTPWSTCDNLDVKRCETPQRCGIWRGHHHIRSAVLGGANTMIVAENGTTETIPEYNILYVTRTSFLSRFRIWSQNSNILSVASDIAWFLCINTVNDQFSHSRCSNHYNYYSCCQEVVLYVQIMDQKSLHQISRYCLWWPPTSDTCRFWQYITYL